MKTKWRLLRVWAFGMWAFASAALTVPAGASTSPSPSGAKTSANATVRLGDEELFSLPVDGKAATARAGSASRVLDAAVHRGETKVDSKVASLGSSFRSLVIATVAINEVVGPVVFKWALDRAKESGAAPRA